MWTLLYLDEETVENPQNVWLYRRQYEGGCTSPVLYAEAIIFWMNPSGLTKLTDLDPDIVWAVRNKQTDRDCEADIYLSGRQKNFSSSCYLY